MLGLELRCIANAVLEQGQAAAGCLAPSPARVLQREDVVLGVWHQAENVAGLVADTGDVGDRTVRVVRVANCLTTRKIRSTIFRRRRKRTGTRLLWVRQQGAFQAHAC